jgi:hypothetical protein
MNIDALVNRASWIALALFLAFFIASPLEWLLDDPGPTWLKRAQNPNLGRPEVERLLRRECQKFPVVAEITEGRS